MFIVNGKYDYKYISQIFHSEILTIPSLLYSDLGIHYNTREEVNSVQFTK